MRFIIGAICIKSDGICINNDEFCFKNEENGVYDSNVALHSTDIFGPTAVFQQAGTDKSIAYFY